MGWTMRVSAVVVVALVLALVATGCAAPGPTAVPSPSISVPSPSISAPSPSISAPSPSISASTPSTATGEPSLTPIPTIEAVACPTDTEGSLGMLQRLDHSLRVGDTIVRDGTIAVQAIHGDFGGDDAVPAFATLDLEAKPILTPAGANLLVREESLTLVALTVRRYDLAGFTSDGGIQYAGRDPLPLDVTVVAGDGTVSIPAAAGDYALELSLTWESACFRGEGITYAVVRVR